MILSLTRFPQTGLQRAPERRRVVIIGAGAAGLTAAMHIGEHALLLEQRSEVSSGISEAGAAAAAPREWIGTAVGGYATGEEQVRITRWTAPVLTSESPAATESRQSMRSLVPLLRGELRLDTRVTRLTPMLRRLELATGAAIVYDKLVSTVRLPDLVELLGEYVPTRVRTSQSLMHWLNARDVELADEDSRALLGDADPFAAGRRAAERVAEALERKFRASREPHRLLAPLSLLTPHWAPADC